MSNLLNLKRVKTRKQMPPGKVVGAMEFGVNPATAPYLVTTSQGLSWVLEPFSENRIRAAIRQDCTADIVFSEIVVSVRHFGKVAEWGNVHPLTVDGVREAIGHVQSYDMGDLELLIPPTPPTKRKGTKDIQALCVPFGLPLRPSSWMPKDTVVVVPKNRAYVGDVWTVSQTTLVAVVHNPARAIGIASKA